MTETHRLSALQMVNAAGLALAGFVAGFWVGKNKERAVEKPAHARLTFGVIRLDREESLDSQIRSFCEQMEVSSHEILSAIDDLWFDAEKGRLKGAEYEMYRDYLEDTLTAVADLHNRFYKIGEINKETP
jgi:hypothetical protein